MKKVLKLVVAIILAILILSVLMFLIDCSRGKSGEEPIFSMDTMYDNGGGSYYTGLGYVMGYNMLSGEIYAKLWGLFSIELREAQTDFDIQENNNTQSENTLNNTEKSGDLEINNLPSGEVESGDTTIISGDNENNDITSGEQEKEPEEKGYYFNATIIGVNGKNLIVQALEGEEITKSSDMFSFSLEENEEYLIGQKVRIKYTGTIRESYPAQIDVLEIKIIE